MEAEVETLQHQLGKYGSSKKKSIWDMRKEELVEEAKQVLGWDYVTAEEQTVGQLRMFLKKTNQENQPKKLLPTSINRMKKEDLQAECVERDISIQVSGKDLAREPLIRLLLEWEENKLLSQEPVRSNVKLIPVARGSSSRSRMTAKGRPILAGIQPQIAAVPENPGSENMVVDARAEEHRSTRRALVRPA